MARISLLLNLPAMAAQRQFAQASSEVSDVSTRLASGLRINKASDDAAGLAISANLDVDARVFAAGIKNINDGISLLGTSEEALKELGNITIRSLELAEQAANGVYSPKQRQAIDKEAQALVREYNRIISTTSFNGIKLLDYASTPSEVTIQAGYGTSSQLTISSNDSLERTVGDGTFSGSTNVTTIEWGYDAAIADLNNDGRADLVVGGHPSSGSTRIGVSMGNGAGGFGATTYYNYGSDQVAVELVDLNGDNMLDLISAGGGVNVRLATSPGVFGASTTYSMVSTDFEIKDINNDGNKDIVSVGTGAADYVQTRLGASDGTFGALNTYTFSVDFDPTSIALGDVNNDGYQDAIATGNIGFNGSFYVRLNDGTGAFNSSTTVSAGGTGYQYQDSSLADMNLDGNLDLVIGGQIPSSYPGFVSIFQGNGNGTFASSPTRFNNPNIFFVQDLNVSDLNGDGIQDILIAGNNASSAGQISTLLATSENLTYSSYNNIALGGSRYYGIGVGDLNNDGAVDIVGTGLHANTKSTLGNQTKTTNMAYYSLSTQDLAQDAIVSLRSQLNRINSEIGRIGAMQSRFQTALGNLQSQRENSIDASSRIKDADVAEETSKLIRQKIIQTSAAKVISSTSLQYKMVLDLLND